MNYLDDILGSTGSVQARVISEQHDTSKITVNGADIDGDVERRLRQGTGAMTRRGQPFELGAGQALATQASRRSNVFRVEA
jgi:hypothetical protein